MLTKIIKRLDFGDGDIRIFVRSWVIRGVSLAAGFVLLAGAICAQPQHQLTSPRDSSLRGFLRDFLKTSSSDDVRTRYSSAFVDLNDDGKPEAIVYLAGRGWCGTGGCTTLVLASTKSSFRVVSKIAVTRPPIRVLDTKSKGWHDISVRVQGGGLQAGYEARLSFDGETYPSNPSLPSCQRLIKKVAGQVVVHLAAEGTPLYQ